MDTGSKADCVSAVVASVLLFVTLWSAWRARSKEKASEKKLRNELYLNLKDLEKASYHLSIHENINLPHSEFWYKCEFKPKSVSKFIHCADRLKVSFNQAHLLSYQEHNILLNLINQCMDLCEIFKKCNIFNHIPCSIIEDKIDFVQKSIDECFKFINEQDKPDNQFLNQMRKILSSCFQRK